MAKIRASSEKVKTEFRRETPMVPAAVSWFSWDILESLSKADGSRGRKLASEGLISLATTRQPIRRQCVQPQESIKMVHVEASCFDRRVTY